MRTRDQYDIDAGAKEISCYIKSIAMTDKLLGQIHDMAEHHGGDWSMMYFSDHGLSYINKDTASAYLTHGDKTRENYDVPFFTVDRNQTERVIIPVQHSGLRFLETFSEWMKISDPSIARCDESLSDVDYTPSNQVINFKGQFVNYDGLSAESN